MPRWMASRRRVCRFFPARASFAGIARTNRTGHRVPSTRSPPRSSPRTTRRRSRGAARDATARSSASSRASISSPTSPRARPFPSSRSSSRTAGAPPRSAASCSPRYRSASSSPPLSSPASCGAWVPSPPSSGVSSLSPRTFYGRSPPVPTTRAPSTEAPSATRATPRRSGPGAEASRWTRDASSPARSSSPPLSCSSRSPSRWAFSPPHSRRSGNVRRAWTRARWDPRTPGFRRRTPSSRSP